MTPRIELHIDELVLHDIDTAAGHLIAVALENEMARQFARQPVAEQLFESRDIARLDAGAFPVPSHSDANTIGAQIGKTLFEGLVPSP